MALGLLDRRAATIVKRKKREGNGANFRLLLSVYDISSLLSFHSPPFSYVTSSSTYSAFLVLSDCTGEKISLRDVKEFPLSLWLIFLICVMYYVSVFPFIGLATYCHTTKPFTSHVLHAQSLNAHVYTVMCCTRQLFSCGVSGHTDASIVYLPLS